MAVRYAQFLGILFDSSHNCDLGKTMAGVGESGPSACGRGSFLPGAEEQGQGPHDLGDFDLSDIVNGLGNIGDLVDWPGPLGMFGGLGFLPNG